MLASLLARSIGWHGFGQGGGLILDGLCGDGLGVLIKCAMCAGCVTQLFSGLWKWTTSVRRADHVKGGLSNLQLLCLEDLVA